MITTNDQATWLRDHDQATWSQPMIRQHDHNPWSGNMIMGPMIRQQDYGTMIMQHDHNSWSGNMITGPWSGNMITTHDHATWSRASKNVDCTKFVLKYFLDPAPGGSSSFIFFKAKNKEKHETICFSFVEVKIKANFGNCSFWCTVNGRYFCSKKMLICPGD